jgi:hypothetical protein
MVGQASSLSVGAHGCAPFVVDRQDAGPHLLISFSHAPTLGVLEIHDFSGMGKQTPPN